VDVSTDALNSGDLNFGIVVRGEEPGPRPGKLNMIQVHRDFGILFRPYSGCSGVIYS